MVPPRWMTSAAITSARIVKVTPAAILDQYYEAVVHNITDPEFDARAKARHHYQA